jgi:hypothetical protein
MRIGDEDIAIIFFSGLDNSHYAEFEASCLNGHTTHCSFKQQFACSLTP